MSYEISATPSLLLTVGFAALSVGMLGFWVALTAKCASRRAAMTVGLLGAIWMTATALAAHQGALSNFDKLPPPIVFVLLPMIILVVVFAVSPVGARLSQLPLSLLVGLHVFRLPVELLIHRAASEGIAPYLMTWEGRNFDIVTAILAAVFGLLIHKGVSARALSFVFNLVGLALLANVVTSAILAMPTAFRVFETQPPNVWVAHFPFVWLPSVLVASALLGHLLIGRRLRTA